MAGAALTGVYRGRAVTVTVLERGFAYGGTVYRSLTAVAQAVTGQHWSGFHFLGVAGKGSTP
jgi:transposase